MARINLLPWRAERRKQRQREFQTMLGLSALAGVLLAFLLWFHYERQVSGQQDRNRFLEDKIAEVKKQNGEIKELDAKKDRLLARKKVIEELQSNRSQMVHLFDSLVRTIPDGVALSSLKQEGDILTLQGSAQSNARVSAYMRNLETSGWMTKPDLSIIEARKEAAPAGGSVLPYTFTLKVKLANPNTNEDGTPKVPEAEEDVAAEVEPDPVPDQATPGDADAAAAPQPSPQAAPAAAPTTQGSPAS